MSRLDEIERRLTEVENHLGIKGTRLWQAPLTPAWRPHVDCGCLLHGVCANAACPRRISTEPFGVSAAAAGAPDQSATVELPCDMEPSR